jgi:hypothetical protein
MHEIQLPTGTKYHSIEVRTGNVVAGEVKWRSESDVIPEWVHESIVEIYDKLSAQKSIGKLP